MNQILSTSLNNNNNNDKLNNDSVNNNIINQKIIPNENYSINTLSNKIFFKLQFAISIMIIITIISFSIYYFYSLNNKEKLSQNLIGNYNIYKLYADVEKEQELPENNLFGIIEIPKINLYYPVLSNLTEENLKVSPCKFYGNSLKENGNICIAGHNYNNDMFFSKINLLESNDEIYIYDNIGNKYTYSVIENYEVEENNLSPVFNYDVNKKNLTLITCNNLNNNRIIIKATQKTF